MYLKLQLKWSFNADSLTKIKYFLLLSSLLQKPTLQIYLSDNVPPYPLYKQQQNITIKYIAQEALQILPDSSQKWPQHRRTATEHLKI